MKQFGEWLMSLLSSVAVAAMMLAILGLVCRLLWEATAFGWRLLG